MDDSSTDSIIHAQPVVARKRCTKCGEEKAETEFYIKNKATGRRDCQCKRCVIDARIQYSKEHPDKVWKNNPENRLKTVAANRVWYEKNKEAQRERGRIKYQKTKAKVRQYAKERYYKNREAEIARTLKWRNENPEKCRAWVVSHRQNVRDAGKRHKIKFPEAHFVSRANRRARKEDGATRLSVGIRATLMQWQNGLCPYCRADLNAVPKHLDHLIPLARGGKHRDSNMQLTCKPCNLRKHAKDPILFGREMGIFTPSTELAI